MEPMDCTATLPAATVFCRKGYIAPTIVVELDLETRAGNSAFNPGGAAEDGSGLETFTSK